LWPAPDATTKAASRASRYADRVSRNLMWSSFGQGVNAAVPLRGAPAVFATPFGGNRRKRAPQRMIGLLPPARRGTEAHGSHVLQKLGVPESEDGHRRVLAVLAHLGALRPRTEPRSQVSRASVARRLTNDLRVRQVRRNAGVNTGWLGVIRFPHQLTYPWCSRGAARVAGDREAGDDWASFLLQIE
jgi:hypothetical protein